MSSSTPGSRGGRLPRLHELPPFSCFADLAREFGVEFTLYGGAAARTAMYLEYRPSHAFDLFDVAPFTSDIDLRHTGSEEQTPLIRDAIRERVPFASWCRWSLLNAEKSALAQDNMDLSTRVPLRSIRFETKQETDLPADALSDLLTGQVSVFRNTGFSSSGLAKSDRDLEVFGALLALNTLVDLREVSGGGTLAQWGLVRDWLFEADALDQLGRAAKSATLGARLWHMLAPQVANADPSDELWQEALDGVLRVGSLQQFGLSAGPIPDAQALSVSRPISSGGFRVPELLPSVLTGARARTAVSTALERLSRSREAVPRLDPAFEVVAFIPDLTVAGGTDVPEQERDDGHYSQANEEFLHLTWKPRRGSGDADAAHGLTAFAVPSSYHDETNVPTTALAVGGIFRSGRPWVRIDVADFIGDRNAGGRKVGVAVVQARHG
jgi:hypothetical protein